MKAGKETALVNACLELLRLKKVVAWRNNSGAFVLGSPGERKRFFRAGVVGSADIFAVLPGGTFLACECKVKPNKPTQAQRAFLDAVNDEGGVGLIVYDVKELEEWLNKTIG